MQARILPSRQALVDRIELQYEYGQPIISLLGQSGLGKSYLLETFLSNKYPELSKIYLSLNSKSDDLSVISQILEQSFKSPLIDQSLSLTDNFKELCLTYSISPILLVIDNAQYLSDELTADIELLTQFQQVLVLTASVGRLQFSQSTNIFIEPLSAPESRQFLAMYYERLPHSFDPVFTHFIEVAEGNPNLLLNWGEIKIEGPASDPKIIKRQYLSWLVSLLILLVVVISSFLYFFYEKPTVLSQQENDQEVVQLDLALQQTEITDIAPSVTVSENLDAAPEQGSADLLVSEPEITSVQQLATIEFIQSDDQIAAPETVDINNNAQPNHILAELLLEPDEVPQLTQEPQLSGSDSADLMAVKPSEPAVNSYLMDDFEWFSNQNDKLIMLQLIALSNRDVLVEFLESHELVEPKIYQTVRNDKQWWVVTIGPYTDIAQSQEAKAKLVPQLLQLQPFSKSIATINNEIARLKRK